MVVWSSAGDLHAQDCTARLLLDATQHTTRVGIDTSGMWWALTQPYHGFMGLVIDGDAYGPAELFLAPKISFDGSTFIAGIKQLGLWSVLTQDDTISLNGDVLDDVFLPSQSSIPWWLHSNNNDRILSTYERSYRCVNVPRMVCFDPQGFVAAWVESRGNMEVIIVNGKERVTADQVILGGVSGEGSPIYAVRFGSRWSVFRGQDEVVSSLASLSEFKLDPFGISSAWIASDGTGTSRMYLHNLDMNAPWTSLPVQSATGLCLSPFDALVAARIIRNGNNTVSYNGVEYPSGRQTGPIGFSHDGSMMVYAGFDGDYFVTVNGKRHWVNGAVNLGVPLQINTDGSAVGWASATTLAYANLESKILRLGRMCDSMGSVIYDRRSRTFKGLGFVSGRLFLLECNPN